MSLLNVKRFILPVAFDVVLLASSLFWAAGAS
jgi:hypothetical protein